MIKQRKCFYCNTELEVVKEGYTITDFCTSIDKKCHDSVEVLKTYLCRCNICKREETIKEEEPTFISLEELYSSVKNDKVFSDNPEVLALFKIIQRLMS